MFCVLNKNSVFQQEGINGLDTYFILIIFLTNSPLRIAVLSP